MQRHIHRNDGEKKQIPFIWGVVIGLAAFASAIFFLVAITRRFERGRRPSVGEEAETRRDTQLFQAPLRQSQCHPPRALSRDGSLSYSGGHPIMGGAR